MSETVKKELERMIQGLEAQKRSIDLVLSPLKEALANLHKQPSLKDLKEEAAQIANGRLPKRRMGNPTQYELIAGYLVEHGNGAKTMRELAEGIGTNQKSMANVLYSTHKKNFVFEERPGFKHRLAWKLTPEAYSLAAEHH